MSEQRWRVGSRIPLNVYEGDRAVCQCHTAEDARLLVGGMNAQEAAKQLLLDANVAHRWFAEQFGDVMNGRDFAVKCAMASRELAEMRERERVLRAALRAAKGLV